ncbi:hypothetical protein M8J77_000082 [Diaphorina citri]|nr:hypothetical protein M8J77_000082 [Diaphorina citri]
MSKEKKKEYVGRKKREKKKNEEEERKKKKEDEEKKKKNKQEVRLLPNSSLVSFETGEALKSSMTSNNRKLKRALLRSQLFLHLTAVMAQYSLRVLKAPEIRCMNL